MSFCNCVVSCLALSSTSFERTTSALSSSAVAPRLRYVNKSVYIITSVPHVRFLCPRNLALQFFSLLLNFSTGSWPIDLRTPFLSSFICPVLQHNPQRSFPPCNMRTHGEFFLQSLAIPLRCSKFSISVSESRFPGLSLMLELCSL